MCESTGTQSVAAQWAPPKRHQLLWKYAESDLSGIWQSKTTNYGCRMTVLWAFTVWPITNYRPFSPPAVFACPSPLPPLLGVAGIVDPG